MTLVAREMRPPYGELFWAHKECDGWMVLMVEPWIHYEKTENGSVFSAKHMVLFEGLYKRDADEIVRRLRAGVKHWMKVQEQKRLGVGFHGFDWK